MHAWICRILSFVFLLNVLFPAPVLAQTASSKKTPPVKKPVDINKNLVDAFNGTTILEGFDSYTKNHLSKIGSLPKNPYRTGKLAKEIVQKHVEVETEYYKNERARRLEIEREEYRVELGYQSGEYLRQDNARIAKFEQQKMMDRNDRYYGRGIYSTKKTADAFLSMVEKDSFTLEDLIDWLDPYLADEQYYTMNIAYAGEVFGNTLDQVLQEKNKEAQSAILEFLPEVQQRILYRIDRIKATTGGVLSRSQEWSAALGTLRITLAKINQFYNKVGKQDPLMAMAKTLSGQPDLYKKYAQDFSSEMRGLSSVIFEDGTENQQKAALWADYATTYFLISNQEGLTSLVKLADNGNKTDFKKSGAPVLQSIFTSILENCREMRIGTDLSNKVIKLLKELSDPAGGYSLLTRVLALEAASTISRYWGRPSKFKDDEYRSACFTVALQSGNFNAKNIKGVHTPPPSEFSDYGFKIQTALSRQSKKNNPFYGRDFLREYSKYMSYVDRHLFAKRIGDIYCPAVLVHVVGGSRGKPGEDYGLNSGELSAFADKLGYMYDGFINITTPVIRPAGEKVGFDHVYKGTGCNITTKNTPNKKMQTNENVWKFYGFIAESLFWVYGGEILSAGFRFIGIAYRSVRGVTLASPKIIKAAVKARSGRKLTVAAVETKKAVRYANATQNLTKQGAQMVVTANQASGAVGKGTVATAETAARGASNPTTFVASNMSQLRTGQRHWLQRLGSSMSGNPRGAITEISVVQQVPGFTYNVGTASVGGTRLAGGIRNYDDWRYLQRLLRTPTEGGGSIPFKLVDLNKPWNMTPNWVFYGSNKFPLTGKELLSREMELSLATYRAVEQGRFDLWLVNNGVGYNISRTADLSTLPWKGSHNFFVAPSSTMKTLNLVGEYSGGVLKIGDRMAIPWMPANSHEAVSLAKNFLSKPSQWGQLQTWSGKQVLGRFPTSPSNLDWLPNFTNHLSTTGQLDLLAGNLIQSTKFWQGFTGNLKFFGAWTAMDLAVYPWMNKWVENKAGAQYEELLAPYKDTFEQVKQDQKEQNNGVEPAPAPLGIYDAVNAAQKGDFRGALISFPMLGILHSKPGQFLFGERSFVAEKDRVFYPHLAAKLDLSHALYTREKTKMAKQSIEQIEAERTTQVAQAMAVGGEAAAQEMQAAYDAFIAKAKKLQEDNVPAWKWNEKLKEERQALDRLILLNTIKALEQQKEQDLQLLSSYGEEWVVKGKAVYDSYINGIKGLTEGDLSSDGASEKLGRLADQFTQQMGEITEGLKSSSSVMESYYTEEMFDMVSYIQSLEDEKHMAAAMYSPEDGAKLMAIYDDAIRKMEELANSSGLSQQNKVDKQNEIMSEWYEKMEIFQQEHRPDQMRLFDANAKRQLSYVPEADKAKYQALIDAYRPHLAVIVSDSSLSEEDRIAKVSQFWEEFANEWSNVSAGVAQPEEVPAEK